MTNGSGTRLIDDKLTNPVERVSNANIYPPVHHTLLSHAQGVRISTHNAIWGKMVSGGSGLMAYLGH